MANDTEINQLPSQDPVLSDVVPYSKGDLQTFKTTWQKIKDMMGAGEKGDKGDKGDTGDKGDKGDKGDAGTVIDISVSLLKYDDQIIPIGVTTPIVFETQEYDTNTMNIASDGKITIKTAGKYIFISDIQWGSVEPDAGTRGYMQVGIRQNAGGFKPNIQNLPLAANQGSFQLTRLEACEIGDMFDVAAYSAGDLTIYGFSGGASRFKAIKIS